jgi:HEPN domain-containing protein
MQFDRITDYIKAAPRRLADARELLQDPTYDRDAPDAQHRHLRGAVYLSGYAVEFALKAYIISRTPGCQTFAEARKLLNLDLDGARSHNLRLLARATDLEGALNNLSGVSQHWIRCWKWRPDQRYDGTHMTCKSDAKGIVDAAETIWRWVEQQRRP